MLLIFVKNLIRNQSVLELNLHTPLCESYGFFLIIKSLNHKKKKNNLKLFSWTVETITLIFAVNWKKPSYLG